MGDFKTLEPAGRPADRTTPPPKHSILDRFRFWHFVQLKWGINRVFGAKNGKNGIGVGIGDGIRVGIGVWGLCLDWEPSQGELHVQVACIRDRWHGGVLLI